MQTVPEVLPQTSKVNVFFFFTPSRDLSQCSTSKVTKAGDQPLTGTVWVDVFSRLGFKTHNNMKFVYIACAAALAYGAVLTSRRAWLLPSC